MTHDLVAVGIGPFNLGLACLAEPIEDLDAVFLDRTPGFDWHPGMLLEASTLQTPFLADLVTLADPTSPYSFLNYAKQAGHLYSFYIRESFHPLRSEYNDYCRWAAEQLPSLRFGRDVHAIEHDPAEDVYVVHATTAAGERETYRARHLVLGTGTPPFVPDSCRPLLDDDAVVHSSGYLPAKPALQERGSIAVIGGGQSAAEIFYDLLEELDQHDYDLTWVTRSPRFFPLEYTKLTLEMTSPEYMEYFHRLPPPVRDDLVASQAPLYKGIDASLIDDIFRLLYRKHRRGDSRTTLLTNTELTAARRDGDAHELELRQVEQEQAFTLRAEGLVLGTGYRRDVPDYLAGISDRIAWDEHGRFAVNRNFTIDRAGRAIFVQNAELHTHGFVAPDLGMASYRNSLHHPRAARPRALRDRGVDRLPGVRSAGVTVIGRLWVRPVDVEADADLLHVWLTDPKSAFWDMQDADVDTVRRAYGEIEASPWHEAYIGLHDGTPAFLMERYDPAHDAVGDVYEVQDGDVGMHFLVAPTDEPVHGFTLAVIWTVMDLLFTDPATRARRRRARRAQRRRARAQRRGRLPRRARGRAAGQARAAELLHAPRLRGGRAMTDVDHLDPTIWAEANRRLVAKALAEFAHERLLAPEPEGDGYALRSDDGAVAYRFAAERLALDHWQIDAGSLTRERDGEPLPVDALDLVLDLRDTLSLEGEQLGLYLEEITSTLAAMAYKLSPPPMSAAELAAADFQTIEARMTEGHPVLRGQQRPARLGRRRLPPLRARGRGAGAPGVGGGAPRPRDVLGLRPRRPCSTELGRRFAGAPRRARARPRRLPADPRAPVAVAEPARGDVRRPTSPAGGWSTSARATTSTWPSSRSARSSTPAAPPRHYVKTALSVVNMGFVRGLSAAYMDGTPAINDWVAELVAGDERARGLLGPARARLGRLPQRAVRGGAEPVAVPRRCSPRCGGRARRRASRDGRAAGDDGLAAARRRRRPLARGRADRALRAWTPEEWLRRYLDAYLRPLLHCFYAYDLVFMPHGENVILVLRDDGRRAGDHQGHRRGDRADGPRPAAARQRSSGSAPTCPTS